MYVDLSVEASMLRHGAIHENNHCKKKACPTTNKNEGREDF